MSSLYRNKSTNNVITISLVSGGWQVQKDGRLCPNLDWGEMLQQVIHLTHPSIQTPRYKMLTAAEHRREDLLREQARDIP